MSIEFIYWYYIQYVVLFVVALEFWFSCLLNLMFL